MQKSYQHIFMVVKHNYDVRYKKKQSFIWQIWMTLRERQHAVCILRLFQH